MNYTRLISSGLLVVLALMFIFNCLFALGSAFLALASVQMSGGQKEVSQFQKIFKISLFVAAVGVMIYTMFSDYMANS
jgi:NhaP-type Na+/H+ and K+/H+ antiporter